MNIEIIASSPRTESVTFRLALFLQRYLNDHTEHSVNIIDVRDWALPLLQQQVFNNTHEAPEALQPMAARIFAANAFIIVTPEYNGSYTAALKNLFDHFPKQHHKAFGIVTASPGALGGIRAALQLQLFINALFGIASPYMMVTPLIEKKFDAAGNLIDAAFQRSIDTFITEFLWLSESLVPALEVVE